MYSDRDSLHNSGEIVTALMLSVI